MAPILRSRNKALKYHFPAGYILYLGADSLRAGRAETGGWGHIENVTPRDQLPKTMFPKYFRGGGGRITAPLRYGRHDVLRMSSGCPANT